MYSSVLSVVGILYYSVLFYCNGIWVVYYVLQEAVSASRQSWDDFPFFSELEKLSKLYCVVLSSPRPSLYIRKKRRKKEKISTETRSSFFFPKIEELTGFEPSKRDPHSWFGPQDGVYKCQWWEAVCSGQIWLHCTRQSGTWHEKKWKTFAHWRH